MQNTLAKLLGAWCALILSLPFAYLWLRSDIMPGHYLLVGFKLLVLLAAVGVTGLIFTYAVSKRWAQRTELLENFADSLPGNEAALPEGGPDELQSLAKAMRRMARRVQQLVERASLELSRRETILACMAEGVLAVDRNLRVNFCNAAFAEAFSTRVPESEGRTLYEVVREPVLRDILERVAKTGIPERDLLRLPSAAGRCFEARSLPLGDEARRGAMIALHDVTDIERQEQVRKQFVADVSHELRTPLTAIRGYAETLLDGGLEDEANNRKFVEIILHNAIRLNNIAADLLVISELDSNATPAAPAERIALHEVVDAAFNTVERAAAAKTIRLVRDQCQECWVVGYRFRLEQVMVNLLDNAVKFNKTDGEVVVACGPSLEGHVRISVSDTGVGIPSEDIKRVFERFYRVDKSRGRPAGGTGLGLPIVKQVVEQMGGSVSVESVLGRGAKFTIMLKEA
jgi:two-component system, OmpR family, phosphate regulon sensor histidine kinase PhoR